MSRPSSRMPSGDEFGGWGFPGNQEHFHPELNPTPSTPSRWTGSPARSFVPETPPSSRPVTPAPRTPSASEAVELRRLAIDPAAPHDLRGRTVLLTERITTGVLTFARGARVRITDARGDSYAVVADGPGGRPARFVVPKLSVEFNILGGYAKQYHVARARDSRRPIAPTEALGLSVRVLFGDQPLVGVLSNYDAAQRLFRFRAFGHDFPDPLVVSGFWIDLFEKGVEVLGVGDVEHEARVPTPKEYDSAF